ncbi:phospholipase C [Phaeacidiphilus oryzae]|uniref:phospholipase C n=1 Tax=Phaeacidiphilus oryzae TaxID=348818 RepID=UPI00068C3CEF|nr:alkaline phosphatase family protein [Phaeacidiphilus oryzae]
MTSSRSTSRTPSRTRRLARGAAAFTAVLAAGAAGTSAAWAAAPAGARHGHAPAVSTATPIKHLVVLFDENVSFDHYFATYPKAANTDGTRFTAKPGTPKANTAASAGLLKSNPNLYSPQRLSPSQAMTCDQNHSYGPEQKAYDGGKADQFVQNTSVDKCSGGLFGEPGLAMDYYDGNSVTALWNYAQQYTMSDNSYGSTYGPSTPGALNLVAGQTHGAVSVSSTSGTTDPKQTATPDSSVVSSPNASGVGTIIRDPDPAYDDCADSDHTATSNLAAVTQGKNIGDLLNQRKVTWGWFQGGFKPSTAWDGKSGDYAKCDTSHTNVGGSSVVDYSPHHNPFEYYKSTSNPHHLPPSSTAAIGSTDQANHQYDLSDFNKALDAGHLPAVSFLKAGAYQDGHAGYSDPTDEQHFLVDEINALQKSPEWSSTAVVISYDDSDGWYDHVYHAPTNGSQDSTQDASGCQAQTAVLAGQQDRCGPGPRLPLLVISPYAKTDHVDHGLTTQSSITRFIEDNWRTGRIGNGSFDATAGSLNSAFDFSHSNNKRVILGSDGSVKSITPIGRTPHLPDASGAAMDLAASTTSTGSSWASSAGLGAGAAIAVGGALFLGMRRRRG